MSIDFNAVVLGQEWRELKKLNLESGDGGNVLYEGFAWQLVTLAAGVQGFGYLPSHASWVRLIINGVDTGVYINVEKVDKRFLENRDLFVVGQTWLYEDEDVGPSVILHEGGPQDSPAVEDLCYAPFAPQPTCSAPVDLEADAIQYVDMRGLLTEMALDTFNLNNDALFTKGKNFYFADFTTGQKRQYYPWDLDATRVPNSSTSSIYGENFKGDYADLLAIPNLRAQFNEIVGDLICGPWSVARVNALLDAIEPTVGPAIDADIIGGGSAGIALIRDWIVARIAHVSGELEGFQGCPTVQLKLNEIMASNALFLEDPVEPGEFPDWFEIFNPSPVEVDIGGIYVSDDPLDPTKYQIPSGVTIPALGYYLMYADDDGTQGPDHTNFKISASGGTLALYDRDGVTLLDEVILGQARTDVSYGRFPNGSGSWDFMSAPTPGAPNDVHNPPPIITSTVRAHDVPSAFQDVPVAVSASDDSAISMVTLFYDAGSGVVAEAMFDDGVSDDGAAADGVYGALIPGFPDDIVVKYWIEVEDDLGASSQAPLPGATSPFVYVVGYTKPPLVINEFMASNDALSGIEDPDELGAYEDWFEIYNAGASAISLDGMYLSDNHFQPTKYALPAGLVVPAGGLLLFWADSEPLQGPIHIGFSLSAAGEDIGLFDVDARGNLAVDAFSFELQTTNISEGRCPDGFRPAPTFMPTEPLATASPGATNLETSGCLDRAVIRISGVAAGGTLSVIVEGITVVVETTAGQTAEEVAIALAAAITADPELGALGIGASALGVEAAVDGAVPAIDVADSGLTTNVPEPNGLLALVSGAALLWLVNFLKLRSVHLSCVRRNCVPQLWPVWR